MTFLRRSETGLRAGAGPVSHIHPRYHVTRAELNLEQCSAANITMVESAPQLGPGQWLGRFVEETDGVAAGLIRPACANPI